MTASSAAAWYIFEFLLLFLGSYLLNLTTMVSMNPQDVTEKLDR